MKQCYVEKNFNAETRKLITFVDMMIEDYQAQGFTLSVRQLYYQLVAKGMIPNTDQSYKRIASILNDARMAGLIDWDAIEDRNRDIEVRSRWTSGRSLMQGAARGFHMDMWKGQSHRVFVIVEKAALAGVLQGVCTEYDVPLLAARGYPSVSIVRELALEHIQAAMNDDQIPCILHLGDHDPSGIDMTRDLSERIKLFAEEAYSDIEIDIDRIALTMRQIDEKQPPPNPAKTTDSRFDGYRKLYGDESWELDALEPSYLVALVKRKIAAVIESRSWDARREEIETVRAKINKLAEEFA